MNKIIKDLEEGIITLETIISNVICRKCGETLPDHTVLEHFMTNLHTCGDAVTDNDKPTTHGKDN